MKMKQNNIKSLGICTPFSDYHSLNYETKSLYDEAKLKFEKVILIDSREIYYKFIKGEKYPEIVYNGESINNLSILIVRSTKGREKSISLLVHSLDICGTHIMDPLDRFSPGQASKLLSTAERFKKGIGSNTYLAFSKKSAFLLLNDIFNENDFPLIGKPIAGKRGRGVVKVDSMEKAILYVEHFFKVSKDIDDPIFFQKYVNFVKEFRVILIYGKSYGIVEKRQYGNKIAKNVAVGGRLLSTEDDNIISFVETYCSSDGILGVDVGIDSNDDIHIIEANRAPLWKAFQDTTGVNIAKKIIQCALQRIST